MKTTFIPTQLLKKITCFFIGHKPIRSYFKDNMGKTAYISKCNRCGSICEIKNIPNIIFFNRFPIPKILNSKF
jgi:transcription elongation factor Elf1